MMQTSYKYAHHLYLYDALDEGQKQQFLSSSISSGHRTTMTAKGVINAGENAFKRYSVRLVIVCGVIKLSS